MKLNYFVLGSNDRKSAVGFYDALFAGEDWQQIHDGERMTLWQGDGYLFAIAEPLDGKPASVGNGSMAGFQLQSDEAVAALHARALELGGSDEGQPGIRSGRYSAYVRDLDGNKLCLFV